MQPPLSQASLSSGSSTSPLVIPARIWKITLALFLIVYIGGLFIDPMEVDAAQYAAMSMEMAQNDSYLKVYDMQLPYLDKPPLLFWLSSLSIQAFGLSAFSFKLPTLLSTLLGVYSTYAFTRKYYGQTPAYFAAIFLAGSLGYIIFNQDVRTDAMLANFCMFALWQGSNMFDRARFSTLCFLSLGIGLAMLAKGPIGLVFPLVAIFGHAVLNKQVRRVFTPLWFLLPLLVLIVLSPMLYGLFQQYGWEGIRFFLWTQSFGRITGENVWNNNAPWHFLTGNLLWSFLPFTLFFLFGLFVAGKAAIRRVFSRGDIYSSTRSHSEYYSLVAVAFALPALSASHYQLPHYIYIILPQAATLSAALFSNARPALPKWLTTSHLILTALIVIGAPALLVYAFPKMSLVGLLFSVLFLALGVLSLVRLRFAIQSIVLFTSFAALALGFLLNVSFYPHLLSYQRNHEIADEAKKLNVPDGQLFVYTLGHKRPLRSINFHYGRFIPRIHADAIAPALDSLSYVAIITDEEGLDELKKYKLYPSKKKSFPSFDVALLNSKFLNPSTRHSQLRNKYIAVYTKQVGG